MAGYRKPEVVFDIPAAVAERAATRYEVDERGCHISTYSVASHGYAQIGWNVNHVRAGGTVKPTTMTTAHRAAWVHHTGKQIPTGMTVDHLCRVRRCVNPEHLRLLDNLSNATDNGADKPSVCFHPIGATCRRGHDLYVYLSGARNCRECASERTARKRAKAAA